MGNINRRVKILATIGPATDSPEMIRELIKGGMNVARLNMSHATHESARSIVDNIRTISAELNIPVGILMDTQGPAIRTGDVEQPLELAVGAKLVLTVRGETSEEHQSVDVNYDDLVDTIGIGNVVIVDNGDIHLRVLEKRRNQLHCEVLTAGVLASRKHINLPGVRVNLPALTKKDIRDINLGIEMEVDFFAMSFVREASDVVKLRGILEYHDGANQRIIAKLEDQEGIRNCKEIIDVADGIMVARGDLGIECPYEDLPLIQRSVVKQCVERGRTVIVATHMLESMVETPSPTRAEITDVANAVFEEADAIMLSGETSIGSYPLRCVEVMDRIAQRTEEGEKAGFSAGAQVDARPAHIMKAAASMAGELGASALIVFTHTGTMARYASWFRPSLTPIHCFTNDRKVLPQLTLHWGLQPHLIEFCEEAPLNDVETAISHLKEQGHLKAGDCVVAISEIRAFSVRGDTVLVRDVS